MKYLVAILVAATVYVAVCNGGCFRQLPKEGEEHPKGCFYKGKLHQLGSEWRTKMCFDCTCSMSGEMECCMAYGKPVGNNKNCIFKFDRKKCKYDLIPNEKCTEYGMVG